MTKKLIAPAVACLAMLAAIVTLAFAYVLPADAREADRPASSLQAVESHILKTAATASVDKYISTEGEVVIQGTGVTWVYDIGGLRSYSSYWDDSHIGITSATGDGSVHWEVDPNDEERYFITADRAGAVTLVLAETWTEYTEERNEETGETTEVPVQQSLAHSFVISAVDLNNLSGTLVGCVGPNVTSKKFTVKLSDLPASASSSDVQWVSDSSKRGSSWISGVSQGEVRLYVYGTGTHNIKLKAYGKVVSCKAILRSLSLKKTSEVKNTGSLVTYPGKKSTLRVSLTGVRNPKAKWVSTNKSIAKVNKKGVVTAKGKGRCYVKAKVEGATVKVLVEVTSKNAYQAVLNGFADMNTKLTYSQPSRMSKSCRDCSSFVSRCYWDTSLGRHIFLIGGSGAAQWAYNAAAQSRWLNDQGKRVSWNACSVKKLRPGDTIYFETDYAGKDASQWRYIDHAALYVGNGLYLNTGGYGGKGTVGLARYGYGNVKFIGRPCS